jgi:hypothetical protein
MKEDMGGIVTTTYGTYPLPSVAPRFHNGLPSHDDVLLLLYLF